MPHKQNRITDADALHEARNKLQEDIELLFSAPEWPDPISMIDPLMHFARIAVMTLSSEYVRDADMAAPAPFVTVATELVPLILRSLLGENCLEPEIDIEQLHFDEQTGSLRRVPVVPCLYSDIVSRCIHLRCGIGIGTLEYIPAPYKWKLYVHPQWMLTFAIRLSYMLSSEYERLVTAMRPSAHALVN